MIWKKEKDSKNWNQRRFVLSTSNNSFAYYIKPTVNVDYIIIRVRSAFSLVASCVLLKYIRKDDVN